MEEKLIELEIDLRNSVNEYRIFAWKMTNLMRRAESMNPQPKDFLARLTKFSENTGLIGNVESHILLTRLGEEPLNDTKN